MKRPRLRPYQIADLIDDADFAAMTYRDALRCATGPDGRLVRDRLVRIARARGYNAGWVFHNAGRPWREVWEQTVQWRQAQLTARRTARMSDSGVNT